MARNFYQAGYTAALKSLLSKSGKVTPPKFLRKEDLVSWREGFEEGIEEGPVGHKLSPAQQARGLAQVQSLLPNLKVAYSRRPPLVFPYRRGPSPAVAGPSGGGKSQVAGPSSGMPSAQSLGNMPQNISGPPPSVATGSLAHGQQPIAGPSSSMTGSISQIKVGSPSSGPIPQVKVGSRSSGIGGTMGLSSQAGSLMSGGGRGGNQQDLLSAITELIEAIKDLTERMGDENSSKQAASTQTVTKTASGETSRRQHGGRDIISAAASNAPGIEWANSLSAWFASRFGRR